jgi:hypothetical protein
MTSNKNLDYPIIDVDEFTTISNSLLQDNEISADAQLVATFLLSMPKFKIKKWCLTLLLIKKGNKYVRI